MTIYDEALLRTVDAWNEKPLDEWLFAEFREKFVDTMSSTKAFESIGETISLLLQQENESTAIEILNTIIALARQSDTTEIPLELLTQKFAMVNQFSTFGNYAQNRLRELFKHYRLN